MDQAAAIPGRNSRTRGHPPANRLQEAAKLLRLFRTLPALFLAGAILLIAPPAQAQAPGVQIGFCPGALPRLPGARPSRAQAPRRGTAARPSDLAIKITGCPLLIVHLDGTETPAGVKAKILAALLAAGYAAHIDADGNVVIDLDCTGLPAAGIDEYGLVGGLPMLLGMGSCPLPHPTPAHHGTWGAIKAIYR